MKKVLNKGVLLFLTAVAVLYVVIYVVPHVTGLLDVTYVADYGEISIYDDADCWLVRDEEVYTAAAGGTVSRLLEENELGRTGSQVISLAEGAYDEPGERLASIRDKLGSDVCCVWDYALQSGGIVSYYVDGYENELDPGTWADKDYQWFQSLSQDDVVRLGDSTAAGCPVFKIISDEAWYLISYLPAGRASAYEAGDLLEVSFDIGDDGSGASEGGDVIMTVYQVEEREGMVRVCLKSSRAYARLGELRATRCRLVTADVEGLIIENGSLATVDGQSGVYVKSKTGNYIFTPVEIKASKDDKSVIADTCYYDAEGRQVDTVRPYDDILRDPGKASDRKAGE